MVASAYEHYLDTSRAGKGLAENFKLMLGRPCPVEFTELARDTVSSVGLAGSRHLALSASNSTVKIVRHALALDERRVKFKDYPWARTVRQDRSKPRSRWREALSCVGLPCPTLVSSRDLPTKPEDVDAVDDQSEPDSTDVKEVP